MGYPVKAVANFFLERFGDQGIDPLKIQKLVYIAHGWHLAYRDKPLVDDEYPECWRYGPAFPTLYHEFKYLGRLPIRCFASEMDVDVKETFPKIDSSDVDTINLLAKIWDAYGRCSTMQLSRLCHRVGTPWHVVRQAEPSRHNANIKDDLIRLYYARMRSSPQPSTKNES